MGKLLNFERKRLFRATSFFIILILACALTIVSVLVMKASASFLDFAGIDVPTSELETFGISSLSADSLKIPGWKGLISTSMDSLTTLMPIFISIFVAAEFSKGTIKNLIARGQSRLHVYSSKLLGSCLATTAAFVVSALSCMVIGTILWGFADSGVPWGQVFALFFTKLLTYYALTALCVFICMTIRNLGGSLAINIVMVQFVPSILTMIALFAEKSADAFLKFELTTMLAKLSVITASRQNILTMAGIAVAYIVVSTGLGMFIFKNRDI